MMSVGVDVAKATLEVAVGHAGHAVRLGTFAQTADGWADVRNALMALQTTAPDDRARRPRQTTAPDDRARRPRQRASQREGGLGGRAQAGNRSPSCSNRPEATSWRSPSGPVSRPAGRGIVPIPLACGPGRAAQADGRRPTDRLLLARTRASAQPALPVWQPLARAVSELEQVRRRRDEVKDGLERERRPQEHLGVRPAASTTVRASVQRLLKTLEDARADWERAIAEPVQRHATLRVSKQQLLTVPGVGRRVVLPLLVTCERYPTLAAEPGTAIGVVADVGLDPQPHASGASVWQRARISRHADRSLRARLDMRALGAWRADNPVRTFYQRLVARGKPKRLALVAAARQLLAWAWAVFISGVPFAATKTVKLVA